jgi:hypothetical protein
MVLYHAHRCPVVILSCTSQNQSILSLDLCLPKDIFLSDILRKILYAFVVSSMDATCPANPTFLYYTIPIIFNEEYRL